MCIFHAINIIVSQPEDTRGNMEGTTREQHSMHSVASCMGQPVKTDKSCMILGATDTSLIDVVTVCMPAVCSDEEWCRRDWDWGNIMS